MKYNKIVQDKVLSYSEFNKILKLLEPSDEGTYLFNYNGNTINTYLPTDRINYIT
jgi:hypothetical protein